MTQAPRPQVSSHDLTIWHTLRINEHLDAGDPDGIPQQAVTFALRPGERVWAGAPFVLADWRRLGDGSYERSGSFVFGTGTLGLAMMAGSMIGNSVANDRRRQQAAADAVARWVVIDQGTMVVTDQGFYLMAMHGLLAWTWDSVSSVQLEQPQHIVLTGNSDRGRVRYLIQTDVAELVLTLWARARNPMHPQFRSRAWIPQGWYQRVTQGGLQPPPNLSGRWAAGGTPPAGGALEP